MLTIQLHDMDVARVSWYRAVMTEANKFWFYALVLSIMRCILEILSGSAKTQGQEKGQAKGQEKSSEKKDGKDKSPVPVLTPTPAKWPLVKKMIIDSCDLALPGSFIGWVPVTALQVGLAMVVSTLLAGHNVWMAQH